MFANFQPTVRTAKTRSFGPKLFKIVEHCQTIPGACLVDLLQHGCPNRGSDLKNPDHQFSAEISGVIPETMTFSNFYLSCTLITKKIFFQTKYFKSKSRSCNQSSHRSERVKSEGLLDKRMKLKILIYFACYYANKNRQQMCFRISGLGLSFWNFCQGPQSPGYKEGQYFRNILSIHITIKMSLLFALIVI